MRAQIYSKTLLMILALTCLPYQFAFSQVELTSSGDGYFSYNLITASGSEHQDAYILDGSSFSNPRMDHQAPPTCSAQSPNGYDYWQSREFSRGLLDELNLRVNGRGGIIPAEFDGAYYHCPMKIEGSGSTRTETRYQLFNFEDRVNRLGRGAGPLPGSHFCLPVDINVFEESRCGSIIVTGGTREFITWALMPRMNGYDLYSAQIDKAIMEPVCITCDGSSHGACGQPISGPGAGVTAENLTILIRGWDHDKYGSCETNPQLACKIYEFRSFHSQDTLIPPLNACTSPEPNIAAAEAICAGRPQPRHGGGIGQHAQLGCQAEPLESHWINVHELLEDYDWLR